MIHDPKVTFAEPTYRFEESTRPEEFTASITHNRFTFFLMARAGLPVYAEKGLPPPSGLCVVAPLIIANEDDLYLYSFEAGYCALRAMPHPGKRITIPYAGAEGGAFMKSVIDSWAAYTQLKAKLSDAEAQMLLPGCIAMDFLLTMTWERWLEVFKDYLDKDKPSDSMTHSRQSVEVRRVLRQLIQIANREYPDHFTNVGFDW